MRFKHTIEPLSVSEETDCGVLIIGSGAAGLSVLGRLKANGYDDVILLEKDSDIGGIWRTTSYPNLKIHTKSFNYKFFDFRIPRSAGERATKQEILAYFHEYIEERGLAEHIYVSKKVSRIIFLESSTNSHKCEVYLEDLISGDELVLRCTYVVCALGFSSAGTLSVPQFDNAASFGAPIVHSSEFSDSILDDVIAKQKRVCLFGGGKSAHDIAVQFVKRNYSTHLTWVYKKCLWGINFDMMYQNKRDFSSVDLINRYGLSYRESAVSEQTLTLARRLVDSGYFLNVDNDNLDIYQCRGAIFKPEDIMLLRNETTRIKSGIHRLLECGVELDNGQEIETDLLIAATGYHRAANMPLIEIRNAAGEERVHDPRNTKVLFRTILDLAITPILIFTGEVPLQQIAFGYSFYAEWLARFMLGRLEKIYDREAIISEIQERDKELNEDYHWCPQDDPSNMSKGMPYVMQYFMVQYNTMQRILSDIGCPNDFALRLFQGGTDEKLFIELNAELNQICSRDMHS